LSKLKVVWVKIDGSSGGPLSSRYGIKKEGESQVTDGSKDERMRRSIDTLFRSVLTSRPNRSFLLQSRANGRCRTQPYDHYLLNWQSSITKRVRVLSILCEIKTGGVIHLTVGRSWRRSIDTSFPRHVILKLFFLRRNHLTVLRYDPARARRAGIGCGIIVDKTVDTARNRVGIYIVIKPTEFNYKTCTGFECGDKSVYPGYMCPPRVRRVPKSCGYT